MPGHWASDWLLRLSADGGMDCSLAVIEVLREQFGAAVGFPAKACSAAEREQQILTAITSADWAQVMGAPRDGDVLLLRAQGRKRGLGHHIGVYALLPGGHAAVLHVAGGMALLHRLTDLPRMYSIRGYYRSRHAGPA